MRRVFLHHSKSNPPIIQLIVFNITTLQTMAHNMRYIYEIFAFFHKVLTVNSN